MVRKGRGQGEADVASRYVNSLEISNLGKKGRKKGDPSNKTPKEELQRGRVNELT